MYLMRPSIRCLDGSARSAKSQFLRTESTSSSSNVSSSGPGPSPAEVASAESYCSNLLRTYDTPSYTLLPFITPRSQQTYLALRALNLELARIPDTTSNPTIAALRFQFWRDTITTTFSPHSHPPAHPIAILLSSSLHSLRHRTGNANPLSKSWLLRIIAAREEYASSKPFTTLESLEKYAESTYSTLLYLTLQSLPLNSITADHLASHIGKAAGIIAILRGLPLLAFPGPANHHSNSSGASRSQFQQYGGGTKQGIVTLPLDMMLEANLRDEDVFRRGAEAPGLKDAVFKVATRASDHIITARTMLQNLSRGEEAGHDFEYEGEGEHQYADANEQQAEVERRYGGKERSQYEEVVGAFGVMMPAVSTSLWLDRLQRVDFDVFREELRRREWRLPWKAYWAFRRKMF